MRSKGLIIGLSLASTLVVIVVVVVVVVVRRRSSPTTNQPCIDPNLMTGTWYLNTSSDFIFGQSVASTVIFGAGVVAERHGHPSAMWFTAPDTDLEVGVHDVSGSEVEIVTSRSGAVGVVDLPYPAVGCFLMPRVIYLENGDVLSRAVLAPATSPPILSLNAISIPIIPPPFPIVSYTAVRHSVPATTLVVFQISSEDPILHDTPSHGAYVYKIYYALFDGSTSPETTVSVTIE